MSASAALPAAFARAIALPDAAWTRRATVLACGLLIVTHPVSLLNLFVSVHPSAILALLMLGVVVWHFPQAVGELTRHAALPVTLWLAWETVLMLGHALRWSYFSYWANPGLAINAFSYLLLPQCCFLVLGLAIGREPRNVDRLLRVVLFSGATAIAFGIAFYVLRPGFVQRAEVRTFGEMVFRYEDYLPRMNGYFNSMILGSVCSTTLGLALFSRLRPAVLLPLTIVCTVGSAMTMQRGSWLLTGACAAPAVAVILWRGVRQAQRPRSLVFLILLLSLIGAGTVWTWRFAQTQPWFSVAVQEFDSRVGQLNYTVEERSDQWARALQLAKQEPLGVGLGMLGNKARDIEGLYPYAITDGDLFSILAEQGVPGLALFLIMAVTAMGRILATRRFDVGAPFLLLLVGAIGTNLFDLYYISFVFWLLLGCALTVPPRARRQAATAPTTAD